MSCVGPITIMCRRLEGEPTSPNYLNSSAPSSGAELWE